MHDLFTNRFDNNVLPMMGASFETTKRTYVRELEKLTQYYRSANFLVNNQHLLCRILDIGTPPIDYDIDRFMEAAYTRSPFIARNFQLTSESSYGKWHDGVFYGPGSLELILSIEEYFDYDKAEEDWENIQSIKVLEHPMSDLGMLLPTGVRIGVEKGMAVFSIDLPKLFLQYRCWLKKQLKEDPTKIQHEGIFVHKYLFPQMLGSQTDIAIRNRLMNMLAEAPMGAALRRHPIAVSDYTSKVDDVLKKLLPRLKDAKMLYQTAMVHIPSISSIDGYAAEMMPDMVATNQCRWAIYLARLPMVMFLRDLQGPNIDAYNGVTNREILRETRRLLNDGSFEGRIHKDLTYDVLRSMKIISDRG